VEPGSGVSPPPDIQFGPSGRQAGARLKVELISAHARIGGMVDLGSYARLSDLVNFQDGSLELQEGVILNRSGIPTSDGAAQLEVRPEALTIILDRSGHVPPHAGEAIEKRPLRMVAVTDAHVVTGTFYVYPSAEPVAYLRAREPQWLPLTDVRVRWMVDRRIRFGAPFALLNRSSIVTAALA
jgi:hypothetical protein